jgi:predicted small lipoprotein YifL
MPYSIATLALAASLLLSGCGQIGPLYEPVPEAPPPPTATTGSTPTETP